MACEERERARKDLAEVAGLLVGNPIAAAVGIVDGVKHEIAQQVKMRKQRRVDGEIIAGLRREIDALRRAAGR